MMKASLMRVPILLVCLCLSACGRGAPEPDPAQVEAAAVEARRAQGEAAIRAKRAELRAGREKSRTDRREQQKLRDAMTKPGEEALRQQQGHYQACVKARQADPSIRCSASGRVPSKGPKQLEGFEGIARP
jgi:hypothetical protein